MVERVWEWEPIDSRHSGSSGDLAKLFKNEPVKEPGLLAKNAPAEVATVLAREAIQNSWDAARALKTELGLRVDDEPKFEIRFVYRSISGDQKQTLAQRLGLAELRARVADASEHGTSRQALGLAATDCLDELDDPDAPLKLLVIEERATTGMGGSWRTADSKLYLALVSVGFTEKEMGAGGSYGYGKAGLIRGSATRTVVAHTRFQEQDDEPGITRRLLGMTYWGQHRIGDTRFKGFARMGTKRHDSVEPFTNDEADEVAVDLGLPVRRPDDPAELGSTFLLVDPTVEPGHLQNAIERNWWPALEERMFEVVIETEDGELLVPRPKKNPALAAFVRAFEIASTSQDNDVPHEHRKVLGSYAPRGSERVELGTVGLVADLHGWSYATPTDLDDDGEGVTHQSLVALVRGPLMVVEYLATTGPPPYVRGVFLADAQVDELLRQTEPRTHDAWQARSQEEGVDPAAPKVAAKVLQLIRKEVREFRKRLNPPSPREQDIRLPLLDDLFKGILEDKGTREPPPPPPDPRLVSINVRQSVHEIGSLVRLIASARFSLTDNVVDHSTTCDLSFRYVFDEDGRRGDECPITVDAPPGFEAVQGKGEEVVLRGELSHAPSEFEIVSAPYDPDWTGQLILTASTTDQIRRAEEVGVP